MASMNSVQNPQVLARAANTGGDKLWGGGGNPVGRLWTERESRADAQSVHTSCTGHQLLRTFSNELKSCVTPVSVDFNSAILRHACSTVV